MGDSRTGDDLARIRARLLPGDPYAGFPVHEWPIDLQGWGSRHPLFGKAIEVLKPRIIVEVGSWKGASAIHMAQEAKRRDLQVQIICVDTWLGSPGTLLRADETYDALHHRYGYPQLYFQFLANVIHTGVADMIVPLPQTSDNAAIILRELDIRPDLVYVDGAHDHDGVTRDLASYFPLMQERGLLVGDDFAPDGWPGVVSAVRGFVDEHGVVLHTDGEKYVIARDAELMSELTAARSRWKRAVSKVSKRG